MMMKIEIKLSQQAFNKQLPNSGDSLFKRSFKGPTFLS
jgi:hypothetical protein